MQKKAIILKKQIYINSFMKNKIITYSQAINKALVETIKKNRKVIIIGLGVDDPKGIFGTTLGIKEKYPNNVFDMPTAENGFTGFALGLAISGYRPVIVHQRVEFSLLSIEQIFNQIAKWHYMSAGKTKVPLVIRLIIGKGWGQGPQHSQSLETIFAHIPGLKVVCPSNAEDAKNLMIASIKDNNPVIFFEHRWCHDTKGKLKKNYKEQKIGKANIAIKGKRISLISFSYSTLECIRAAKILKKYNISCEVLDLRSLRPLDVSSIVKTAKKTKKVLIVDNGMKSFGISSEISCLITENLKNITVERIGVLETPIPSTVSLAKYCYPEHDLIIMKVCKMLNIKKKISYKRKKNPDQPDSSFKGPF